MYELIFFQPELELKKLDIFAELVLEKIKFPNLNFQKQTELELELE